MFGIPVVSCAPREEPADRPNIVLITIDTLRADHLSIYGFGERETPHIDALARRGVVFDRAYCDVTWTTPSMASTWTGQFALRHGMRSAFDRLAESKVTVAEILGAEGYRTGAVVGSYPLDSTFQLDQGFEVYDDEFTVPLIVSGDEPKAPVESRWAEDPAQQMLFMFQKVRAASRRTDAQVTDAALRLLDSLADSARPFLLWVHYFGPHAVLDTRIKFLKGLRRLVTGYPDRVVSTDREVGRFLEALDEFDFGSEPFVILHSDHGEALGEHGFVGHGRYLYEDNLRIPLIMSWPRRLPAGRRVEALVGNVDLAPTMLEAAGIRRSDLEMDGRSLLTAATSGGAVHEQLYHETYLPADRAFAERVALPDGEQAAIGVWRHGLLRPPWKYIVTQPHPLLHGSEEEVPEELRSQQHRLELYQLTEDPQEARNLSGSEIETVAAMEAVLSKLRAAAGEIQKAPKIEASREHIERLRSLGYVE